MTTLWIILSLMFVSDLAAAGDPPKTPLTFPMSARLCVAAASGIPGEFEYIAVDEINSTRSAMILLEAYGMGWNDKLSDVAYEEVADEGNAGDLLLRLNKGYRVSDAEINSAIRKIQQRSQRQGYWLSSRPRSVALFSTITANPDSKVYKTFKLLVIHLIQLRIEQSIRKSVPTSGPLARVKDHRYLWFREQPDLETMNELSEVLHEIRLSPKLTEDLFFRVRQTEDALQPQVSFDSSALTPVLNSIQSEYAQLLTRILELQNEVQSAIAALEKGSRLHSLKIYRILLDPVFLDGDAKIGRKLKEFRDLVTQQKLQISVAVDTLFTVRNDRVTSHEDRVRRESTLALIDEINGVISSSEALLDQLSHLPGLFERLLEEVRQIQIENPGPSTPVEAWIEAGKAMDQILGKAIAEIPQKSTIDESAPPGLE